MLSEAPVEDQLSLVVGPAALGLGLDRFLADRLPGWRLAKVQWALRHGRVLSDRRTLPEQGEVLVGETLTLLPPPAPRARPPMPAMPPILHQDPDRLAVDKPPGMLMHPVGAEFRWGLINLVRARFPDEDIHLAHRLDQHTSGVCLLARNAATNQQLKAAFKERRVAKTYWAIVRGRPEWDERVLDAPIGDDTSSPIRLKQAVVEEGQQARTSFTVLARFQDLSLLSCRPETGRTHQLRVHLEHLGHPILGDRIYGQDPEVFLGLHEGRPVPHLRQRLGHPRHCLHARALRLDDLVVRSPMPPDMARLLARQGPPDA